MSRKFPIYLANAKISSNAHEAMTLQKTKRLGEVKANHVVYSPYEALYLVEKNKAEILKPVSILWYKRPVKEGRFMKSFSKKDKDFHANYAVFRDLRNRGYVVKTALKYGTEFRVYFLPKNLKGSLTHLHAKWIVYPVSHSTKIRWKELLSKSRIAHSTNKKLLLAVVDQEENITYQEIDWIKP
jgi:tRNA-intron endonuclease